MPAALCLPQVLVLLRPSDEIQGPLRVVLLKAASEVEVRLLARAASLTPRFTAMDRSPALLLERRG
jgi:hypothetical protein